MAYRIKNLESNVGKVSFSDKVNPIVNNDLVKITDNTVNVSANTSYIILLQCIFEGIATTDFSNVANIYCISEDMEKRTAEVQANKQGYTSLHLSYAINPTSSKSYCPRVRHHYGSNINVTTKFILVRLK